MFSSSPSNTPSAYSRSPAGRLHDLFVAIEAVTPGEFKQKGAGLTIEFGFLDSPFGESLIAITQRGICHLAFVEQGQYKQALDRLRRDWSGARLTDNPQAVATVAEQIFPPGSRSGPLTLFLKGTNFQLKVWEALLRIPSGRLASYQQIAKTIGRPGAVRAVAGAVSLNPVAWLIPCHRVIRKSGAFGGYRWGEIRKKALIGWEAGQLG